jgi:hypothetical protein
MNLNSEDQVDYIMKKLPKLITLNSIPIDRGDEEDEEEEEEYDQEEAEE